MMSFVHAHDKNTTPNEQRWDENKPTRKHTTYTNTPQLAVYSGHTSVVLLLLLLFFFFVLAGVLSSFS